MNCDGVDSAAAAAAAAAVVVVVVAFVAGHRRRRRETVARAVDLQAVDLRMAADRSVE